MRWILTVGLATSAALPMIAGIAIVWFGVRGLRRHQRMNAIGIPATAAVVDNQIVSGSRGSFSFAPVIIFRTREGREIKTAAQYQSHRSFIAGTALAIRYDPDRPESASVPGTPVGAWATIVLGVLIASSFLCFGLIFGGMGLAVGDLFDTVLE